MRFSFIARSVMLAILFMAVSGALHAQIAIGVSVGFAPPEIPVYEQPICPGDGYIWTPGYWDYDSDDADYFWVPGTWILAPEVGFLWTPPYWGWGGSGFILTAGYWGPVVGFYGGINYGFGYYGEGFYGGRWDHDHFYYNSAVWHVGGDFHNVYNERVNITNNVRISYNGHGGVEARPTPQQEAAAHERHIGAVPEQTQHFQAARSNRDLHASVNHGAPSIAATSKPGTFSGGSVVRASNNGSYKPPAGGGNRAATSGNDHPSETGNTAATRNYVHPSDLPAARPATPSTGNPKQDQKYQQQQDKLYQQQQKDRQKLQAQQDKEHQQAAKQKAGAANSQQLEEKHAQQTQQLQQKHTQQTQQLQQKQSPPPASHSSGGSKPK